MGSRDTGLYASKLNTGEQWDNAYQPNYKSVLTYSAYIIAQQRSLVHLG